MEIIKWSDTAKLMMSLTLILDKIQVLIPYLLSNRSLIMKSLEVFSTHELSQRVGELIRTVGLGGLALITERDHPILLAIPFNQTLLEHGVHRSLALELFKTHGLTLAQAAKTANLTINEFLELLQETDISVVDYSPAELDSELQVG
jgi:predicted HTH domain antitoxin